MLKLEQLTTNYVEQDISVSKMEMGFLGQVVSLCLTLLNFVIQQKIKKYQTACPVIEKEQEHIKKSGWKSRKYLSLFGNIEYSRPSFVSSERGMLYLVDELLVMPKNLWSYNLQELVGENATQTNFRASVKLVNKLLGLGLSSTGSERNTEVLGKQVEAYYEAKEVANPEGAVCFSASFDGKGVPKVIDSAPDQVKEIKRLGKGEKKGKKQMATVGVMSHFKPKKRNVSTIIRGLMGYSKANPVKEDQSENKVNDNRWHQNIHRRGFLADQQKCVDYGIAYIKARMKHPQSRFVVPIDAGSGLEDKVLKSVEKHGLKDKFDGIILDIVHVTEYVWDCANAIFGESSNLRGDWVKKMLEDLLNSKTKKVIEDLERIVKKTDLTDNKKEKIQKAITYFTNHQHKMDYKTFLEKGYPVSSALVESNCKHLVKDRMEHSGMRWSSIGAQNMLDTRAVNLNGDLEDFMQFVQNQQKKIKYNIAA